MNEVTNKIVAQCLPDLGRELLDEIATFGIFKELSANEFVIKQGQLVRYLPVVLNGTVKV